MLAVKPTQMREQFKTLCDKIVHNDETIIVSLPNNENVVIVSEKQYNEMLRATRNTAYLDMIDKSINELNNGGFVLKTLEELRQLEQ